MVSATALTNGDANLFFPTVWPTGQTLTYIHRESAFRKSAPSLQPTLCGDTNRRSSVLAADAKVSRPGLIYTQHHAWLSLAAALSLASNDLWHLLPVTDIFSPRRIHSAVPVSANKAKSSAAWRGLVRESDEGRWHWGCVIAFSQLILEIYAAALGFVVCCRKQIKCLWHSEWDTDTVPLCALISFDISSQNEMSSRTRRHIVTGRRGEATYQGLTPSFDFENKWKHEKNGLILFVSLTGWV